MAGLTFICLAAVAMHGDTLRCTNVTTGDGLVRLAAVEEAGQADHCRASAGCAVRPSAAAIRQLASGPVWCRQLDADADRAGFQRHDPQGRIVARCSTGRRGLSTALVASRRPRLWP